MLYALASSLLLGILVAINPCQLAINISAITYLVKKNVGEKTPYHHHLLYVLGRSITYTLLAWILICLLGGGKNIEGVQAILSRGEEIAPYVLVAMGLFMLYRGLHHHVHEHGDDCHNSGTIIKRNGPLGALILGMTLALAFCPESAVFYFGVMLPLSVTSVAGPLVPVCFAIGAAFPVVVLAFVMHKAANRVVNVTHALEHLQQVLNIITAIIFFVLAGVIWMA